jgi:hypothetical protein
MRAKESALKKDSPFANLPAMDGATFQSCDFDEGKLEACST